MDILSPLYVIQNESMLTLVYQTKMKKKKKKTYDKYINQNILFYFRPAHPLRTKRSIGLICFAQPEWYHLMRL